MIRFVVWIFQFLVKLLPFWSRIAVYLSAIWSAVKSFLSKPAAWLILSLYPILEFFIEMFTGHPGFISTIMSNALAAVFNILLSTVFNIDLQTIINQIPANISSFSCYLGLNKALLLVFHGLVNAMVVLIDLELALIVFWLKWKLRFKFLSLTKM